MNHFSKKVALVTGGASGIGRALCFELGKRGAIVIIADKHPEGAQGVAAEIRAAGGQAEAVGVDVAFSEELDREVDGAAR